MAIKTFSDGVALLASDINTYLNNGGLVYISSTTVGSAVPSVTVSNCFSATYDNYLLQWQGGVMSNDTSLSMTLTGGTGASYYTSFVYGSYSGTTVTNEGTTATNSWPNAGGGYPGNAAMDVILYNPFKTSSTDGQARCRFLAKWGTTSLLHTGANSCTGFVVTPAIGNMTGGAIVVYGYRKA